MMKEEKLQKEEIVCKHLIDYNQAMHRGNSKILRRIIGLNPLLLWLFHKETFILFNIISNYPSPVATGAVGTPLGLMFWHKREILKFVGSCSLLSSAIQQSTWKLINFNFKGRKKNSSSLLPLPFTFF